MKNLTTAILLFLSCFLVEASAAPLFYGQSYGFVVSDPARFVAAMDEYRASKAGQQSPAMPVLVQNMVNGDCLLYTSPSPRDKRQSRMPSSA